MKVSVLVDNVATQRCDGEIGSSLLVESDGKILFDVGQSDLFLRNAAKLGVNLDEVDTVVLSHGHADHCAGLTHLQGKRLICHPGCFDERFMDSDNTQFGPVVSLEEAKRRFDVHATVEPYSVSDSVIFLGEIPRRNNFEAKRSKSHLADGSPDYVREDSALAIRTDRGLVVVTGCAHAGICNTVEYAKQVSGMDNVHAVIGGFHLMTVDDALVKTFEYFRDNRVSSIIPTHCTPMEIKRAMQQALGAYIAGSGSIVDLNANPVASADRQIKNAGADHLTTLLKEQQQPKAGHKSRRPEEPLH